MKRSTCWVLLLLAVSTLTAFGQALQPPLNQKQYQDYMVIYGQKHFAKQAESAEKFLIEHKDADPVVLTQVYKVLILSYANDRNWTKVLETYDRISLAPKLTDKEKDQFAKIAEMARTRLR